MKKLIALALAGIMSLTLIACGGTEENTGSDVTLSTSIVEFYDNTLATIDETPFLMNLLDVDPAMVTDMYAMSEDLYEEAVFYVQGMSAQIDEIAVVKATEGNIDTVVELLNARLEAVKANAFYPEHVELVENAVVVQNGDYAMFAVGHMVDVYVEAFNAEVK